jgi:hypothetical protein
MNASIDETNAEAICAAGGIAPLVALLEAGADSVAATYAAGALMNQAFHASSAEAIRAAGGIAPLVALLGAGADSEVATYAVSAIMNLAASTISAEAIREAGGIAPLVPPVPYPRSQQAILAQLGEKRPTAPMACWLQVERSGVGRCWLRRWLGERQSRRVNYMVNN